MKKISFFIMLVVACQLAWDAAPQGTLPLKSYKIYRKANIISGWKLAGVTNAVNKTYKLYNKGWYRITAVDTMNSEGQPSNTVIFNGRSCGSVASLWTFGTNDGGGSTENTGSRKLKPENSLKTPTGLHQVN
jgi:hypothetical protein